MKMKTISLFLCLILFMPLLSLSASAMTPSQAADVDGDGVVTARDAAIVARFAAGWEAYTDARGNLTYPWKTGSRKDGRYIKSFDPSEAVDFDGYTFRVLTWGGTDNGTRTYNGQTVQAFAITHFSVKDVCPWTAKCWSDPANYARFFTKFSAAVSERNAYLESRYNCHLEEVRVADPFAELMADSYSGTDSYDLVLTPVGRSSKGFNSVSQMTMGLFENVLEIPTVDISQPWYETDLLQRITLDEKLLFLTGASDSALRQSVFLPLIGLKNVSDAYGDLANEQAAANFIYDLVLSGKWTVEKMTDIINTCYAAYPSGTHYSYSAAAYNNTVLALGAGFTAFDRSTGTLYSDFASCPSGEAWSDLCDLLTTHRTITEMDAIQGGKSTSQTVCRAIGCSVYCYKTVYDDAATGKWIAAVPFPKANVSQESYIINPNVSFVCLYTIPAGNAADETAGEYGFENGRDMEGYFISAFMEASLAKHNTKGYDLKDALVYQLAEKGSFHNSALITDAYPQGKALAALQMIFRGITVDPSLLYTPDVYSPFSKCGASNSGWSDVSGKYNADHDTQNNTLERIALFLDID